MKRTLLLIFTCACSLSMMAQFESAPAFPGAEGHGRFTTGGRGGKVIHVTTLNDSGTGSLREAANYKQTEPKIIVFDVSGYIDLKSDLKIGSNTTILGQTAPGDGITIRYYTVEFSDCYNVIVRFIRFRRSQVKNVNDGADAAWGRNQHNIILDHCSFSWSIDELGSFYDNRDFTMQWCSLSEALANPGHSKGEHSYGGIWGGKNASFHHNFLAHMQNRAPRFNGARYNFTGYDQTKYDNAIQAERVDFRNCVMYNWGSGNGCYGGSGGGYINIINNYYKAGPATSNKTRVTQVSVQGSSDSFQGYASRYYINGNYVTAAGSKAANYDWSGIKYDSGLSTINNEQYIPDANHYYGSTVTYVKNSANVDCVKLKLDEPIDGGYITTHSAENAFTNVLSYVGASYKRDAVDTRNMDEAKNGTTTYQGSIVLRPGILDVINDPDKTEDASTASFPTLAAEKHSSDFDTDNDGIEDAWELANGLNPNDASDALTYSLDPKSYYTNVEVYANSLVENIMKAENASGTANFEEYYPSVTSGIETIHTSEAKVTNNAYYNLNGQRVSPDTKGIIICNGKKYINQ